MRTSCNGCRVLRKGCNEECAIRPSVDWIKSPESQANATIFLAKFYGRAGLLNLLSAAPPNPNLRPAIFKSLLYEACGRIVDPVYGSAGLMWSGQWHHCQAAVDAVLKGLPIHQLGPTPTPTPLPPAGGDHVMIPPPPNLCDIRLVSSKGFERASVVQRNRSGSKNIINEPRPPAQSEGDRDRDEMSMFSNETVEHTMANRAHPYEEDPIPEPGLELTLGLSQYGPGWS